MLPLLKYVKFYFRLRSEGDLTYLEGIYGDKLSWNGIMEIYSNGLYDIIGRIQHFSSLAIIWINQDQYNYSVYSGFTKLFLFDGFLGFFILRVFDIREAFDLGSSIISMTLGFDPLISSYATHVGILGWLIVTPELFILYIIYISSLMYISMRLVKYYRSQSVRELNWLAWLLFLMHGWFGVFITYLISGFIYGYLSHAFQPNKN